MLAVPASSGSGYPLGGALCHQPLNWTVLSLRQVLTAFKFIQLSTSTLSPRNILVLARSLSNSQVILSCHGCALVAEAVIQPSETVWSISKANSKSSGTCSLKNIEALILFCVILPMDNLSKKDV